MTRRRRGGIVIIVALSLTVLTGFLAVVFDIGYARLMRTRMDMALEAAAHAAAKELDGTDDGVDRATSAAQLMAERNSVNGHTLTLSSGDIHFGAWDEASRDFTDESEPEDINAVRVTAAEAMPIFFGAYAFRGTDLSTGFTVGSSAIATSGEPGGASATDCVLPLAVPLCAIDNNGDGAIDSGVQNTLFDAGACAKMYSGSTYSQAFMMTDSPFGPNAMASTWGNCEYLGSFAVGDAVALRVDHSLLNSANVLTNLTTQITASGTTRDSRWTTSVTAMSGSKTSLVQAAGSWGKTLEGPIPVVDVGTTVCTSGTSYLPTTTSGNIVGFVWASVYDAAARGTSTISGSCTATNYLRAARIRFSVDTLNDYQYGSVSGGEDWGVTAPGNVRLIPNE